MNSVQKKSKIGNPGTTVLDNPINYEYTPDSSKEFKPSIMTSKNSQSGKGTGEANQATGKRAKNKLKPDSNAEGAHSIMKRDPNTGEVTNYETYEKNPNNPSGFQTKKRYDGKGRPHEVDGEKLLPHVHEYPGKNRVRSPYPWEIPQ